MLQTIKNKIKNILLPPDPDLYYGGHYGNTLHKLNIVKSKSKRLALHLEFSAGSNILLDCYVISECLLSTLDGRWRVTRPNSLFSKPNLFNILEFSASFI